MEGPRGPQGLDMGGPQAEAPSHGNTAIFGYRCGPPSQWPSQRPAYVTRATTTPPGHYKSGSLAPLARLRGFPAPRVQGSKRSQSTETGGCPSRKEAIRRLARMSAPKMARLCQGKSQQNESGKTCSVTKKMASIRVSSGTQSTAAMPGVSSARQQRVQQPKKGVGRRHLIRPAIFQGHRHVHLPNNGEEPMEVDPPQEEEEPMEVDPPAQEEEPMEVDPPQTGQAGSSPGTSRVSAIRAWREHRGSARAAPYSRPSHRTHH